MKQLNAGDRFPELKSESVSHGLITLPDDIPTENFAVILAYRAHW